MSKMCSYKTYIPNSHFIGQTLFLRFANPAYTDILDILDILFRIKIFAKKSRIQNKNIRQKVPDPNKNIWRKIPDPNKNIRQKISDPNKNIRQKIPDPNEKIMPLQTI